MRNFLTTVLSLCLLSYGVSVSASDETEQFPKRKFYPQLNYIDTQELADGLQNNRYDVIDVRDNTSFEALHVKTATNIFVKSKTFDQEMLGFAAQSTRPLVIYCNGISCSKSYVASTKTIQLFAKQKIKRKVFTFDSGINAIAYAHNDMVLKNGKDISDKNPLIAIEKIEQHTLKPSEFESYLTINKPQDYAVLDIRHKSEKLVRKLFMFQKQKNIVLGQRDKLIAFLNKIKKDNKTLLVYDASGRQINGLYELLKITGIRKWYYMEGGEFGYANYAINAAGL